MKTYFIRVKVSPYNSISDLLCYKSRSSTVVMWFCTLS